MMRDRLYVYRPDAGHSLSEALLHVLRDGHALPEGLVRTLLHPHPPLLLAGAEDERPGETH
ncbi:hypothetical protein, partial [Streptomyces griseus]|uniref:hypothetical protein n=1 Tax=Streptomyces griseus TaxID=1911 RepID=UPI001F335CB2